MDESKKESKQNAKQLKKEKRKGLFKELKDFIFRGNVVSMAVGIIVGGAFQKIVTSLVNDVIMPLIGAAFNFNLKDAKWVLVDAVMNGDAVVKGAVTLSYGNFIQTILDFLIIALSLFFALKVATGVSKVMGKAKEDIIDKIEELTVAKNSGKDVTTEATEDTKTDNNVVSADSTPAEVVQSAEITNATPIAIDSEASTNELLKEIRDLLKKS